MSTAKPLDRLSTLAIALWATLLVALLWRQMQRSLWLDEFPVILVADQNFWAATTARVIGLYAAPPYFALLSLSRSLFGQSDLALRLPSLLSILVAALVLYRIVAFQLDKKIATLTSIIFLSCPHIIWAATTARPYALAILFLHLAWWELLKWQKKPNLPSGLLAVLFGAAAVWCHATFLFPAAALALWALYSLKTPGAWRQLLIMTLVAAPLLIGCYLYTLAPLWRSHDFLARHVKTPGWQDLAAALIPLVCYLLMLRIQSGPGSPVAATGKLFRALYLAALPLITVAILLEPPAFTFLLYPLLVALFFSSFQPEPRPWEPHKALLFFLWFVIPLLLAFGLHAGFGTRLFFQRYLIAIYAPAAVLLALLFGPLHSNALRIISACVIAALTLAHVYLFSPESAEDWRGALRHVATLETKDRLDVFLQSCFSERLSVEWISDPKLKEVLLSPLKRYPVKSAVHYTPCLLEYEPFRKTFEDQILETLKARRSFVLLTRFETSARELVKEWATSHSYSPAQISNFGAIEVAFYEPAQRP